MSVDFQQHPPAADLAWCVQYYWTLSGDAQSEAMHPIFPDGSPELVFNLGAIVREVGANGTVDESGQPRAMLVGQMIRPLCIEPTGALDMIGVRLTPIGIAALFPVPAWELRERTLSLDALTTSSLCALPDSLHGRSSMVARLDVIDAALRAAIARTGRRRSHAQTAQLTTLTHAMRRCPPASVDRWSRAIGTSARTIERYFDRYVGLSPKEFARIRRFQRALGLAEERPSLHWSAIAAHTGYADHSHLVRDFHQFAGAAPGTIRPNLSEITANFIDNTVAPAGAAKDFLE